MRSISQERTNDETSRNIADLIQDPVFISFWGSVSDEWVSTALMILMGESSSLDLPVGYIIRYNGLRNTEKTSPIWAPIAGFWSGNPH